MKLGSRKTVGGAMAAMLLCLVAIALAAGQTAPASRPAAPANRPAAAAPGRLMAEQVYKNIKVLRGMTEDQFMDTMTFISGGLGTNCTHCHSIAIAFGTPARWAGFTAETPLKETARKMIAMTKRINAGYFAGANLVTCYTCHRGLEDPPKVIPQLALQYGEPKEEEPTQFTSQDPDSPMPDQILDKYIQAIGGAGRLASLSSFTAKGTYAGYDTDFEVVPMDVYSKAPNQRAWVVHTAFGERSRVFNGRAGWNATPDTSQVRPVLPITAGRLENERVLAQLAFPTQIKTALTRLITGGEMTIGGGDPEASRSLPNRQVYVVQGLDAARMPVKLYFDKETGLLVRVVTHVNSAIGIFSTQIDYSEFRDVSGIKMPFHWVVTAADGQNMYDLTEVQINAAIEEARFAQPAPPRLLTPQARAR